MSGGHESREAREERLAEALRANLRRRKEKARSLKASDSDVDQDCVHQLPTVERKP